MKRGTNLEEICRTFGVHETTVRKWIARGLPCEGEGKARRFDPAEVAAWMKANNLTGEVGKPAKPQSVELLAARVRKETALACRYEMELDRERGRLVDAAKVEQDNVRKFTMIRNNLLGMGATLAPILVGLNAVEIEKAINERVYEILEILTKG